VCDRLGLPHPDYLWELLTWQQWQDWRERWFACPWGDYRDDLRMEFFGLRLMASWFGSEGRDELKPVYPYVEKRKHLSPEQLKAIEG
jgi:hypothetical protein